jgi:hypothetical protein
MSGADAPMLSPQADAQGTGLYIQIFAHTDEAEWTAIFHRKDPVMSLDILNSLNRRPIVAVIQVTPHCIFENREQKIALSFKPMVPAGAVKLLGQYRSS